MDEDEEVVEVLVVGDGAEMCGQMSRWLVDVGNSCSGDEEEGLLECEGSWEINRSRKGLAR